MNGDEMVTDLLANILEHEATGHARLVDREKAENPEIPCKCFGYENEVFCWKPGYLGLISSKKNPEQMANCPIMQPVSNKLSARFNRVKKAVSEAHRNWQKEGKGDLASWWDDVAKSMEKNKVEV